MPKKVVYKMNEKDVAKIGHGKLILRLGDFLLQQLDPMAEQKRLEADRLIRSLDCSPLMLTVEEGCTQKEELCCSGCEDE